jgi:hypothetical protein
MTSPTAPTVPAPAASKRGTSKPAAANGSSRKGHRLQGGTGQANRIAVAILEVLAGLRTPAEAAQSLQISVPRYYVLETRALEGLVAACEPKPLGKQPTPQTRITALEKELQQARHECARQQALVRAAQRTVGLTLPATRPGKQKAEATQGAAKKSGKRRRRRPTVRALRAAKTLRENSSGPSSSEGLEKRVADGSARGVVPTTPSQQEHHDVSQGKETVGDPAR